MRMSMLPSLQISFLSQHRMPPAHQRKQLQQGWNNKRLISLKSPPPPQVNFKDATKTPANKSATFPTIVLYCPTFVGGMPTMPLTASTRNATSKHSNSRQDPKGKKAMHAIFLN
jgi:hypothetical protein